MGFGPDATGAAARTASPKLLDCIGTPSREPRSHGRQLDAVGRHDRSMPRAVARRGLANDLAEDAAERPQAGEADVHADVGDAAVGLAQEEHRALHPPALQIPMRRLPEDGSEGADEVRLGDMRHRGHGTNIERLGVGAVHRVAGAQEAPVQILDVPAHRATLRHQGAGHQGKGSSPLPYARTVVDASSTSESSAPPAVVWRWSSAIFGALCSIPAVLVTTQNPSLGLALAIGVLAPVAVGVSGTRSSRVASLIVGVAIGLGLVVGSALSQEWWLAMGGVFVLCVAAAAASTRIRFGSLLLFLAVPMVGAGLSFLGDVRTAVDLAVLMVVGAIYGWLLSLIWPPDHRRPRPPRRRDPILPT